MVMANIYISLKLSSIHHAT